MSKKIEEKHTILVGCGHTELPSSSPCWICNSGTAWDTMGYQAGTALPFNPEFESSVVKTGEKREILALQGVLFDTIENLSGFHAFEVDQALPYNISEKTNARNTESVYESITEAFWCTLVANRSSADTLPAPESYSCVLKLQAFESWQREFMASDDEYWGTRLGDVLKAQSLTSTFKKGEELWTEAASCARKTLEYRRFVTTSKGYLGVVPAGVQSGDVVAVLAGAEMVVISRPQAGVEEENTFYRVVGLGYLHGLMNGEIGALLEARKAELEEIRLC